MNTPIKSAVNQLEVDQQEYKVIKKDLLKVLLLNAVYLTAILAIYFTDQKMHYLDKYFAKILHF